MGHPSVAGELVHLYLNGLYWGVYNLCERPDENFAASRLGGKPSNYDSMNATKILAGDSVAWESLMKVINSGVRSNEQFRWVESHVELDAFIDYMILNYYGANADWDRSSNWYAARRRNPSGKFWFFVWDAERTLENVDDNTMGFDDDQSPPRIFHRLSENAEFRKRFAQRARLHLTGGGLLTPEKSTGRYKRFADQLRLAIVAESARWGDYRRDVHRYKEGPYELYTRDTHWVPEVDRLLNDYFPKRTAVVLKQFQARGLMESQ
jgi:hypothetical protein